MIIKPDEMPAHHFYKHLVWCITPRPIAWVSSLSLDGVANLAPFSFFNGIGANPPALMFSAVNRRDGSKKDTVANIESQKEFVVNIVSYANREAMNLSSADFPADESEIDACKLTRGTSELVKPPFIQEAAIHMECSLNQIVHLGEGPLAANLIIGNIVKIFINDDVLDADGAVDPNKLDSIGRLGGSSYSRTTENFEIPRPTI